MSNKKVYLTRCPVGNATEIAVQKGWLFEGFKQAGVDFALLQDLPSQHWESHFSHEHPALFRDGGNIPPIWAKSNGFDLKVIGLNFNERRGGIIVKRGSSFQALKDLKGKRVALPVRASVSIDFWRATVLKGFISALEAEGLTRNDVEFVELPNTDPWLASSKDNAYWDSVFLNNVKKFQNSEVEALLQGKVDAIYSGGSRGERLVLDGVGRYIFDFEENKNVSRVNIEYPSTITVSGKLARENPEIVVQYLRILIKASLWAKKNYEEVVKIFAKGSWQDDEEAERKARTKDFNSHLAPKFSDKLISALKEEKDFLLENKFIQKDFSINEWIDESFLESAWKEEKQLVDIG